MSKYEDLRAIVQILIDYNVFNLNKVNKNGQRPIDLVISRLNEKNPYESNIHEIAKLEPLLREDFIYRLDPKKGSP